MLRVLFLMQIGSSLAFVIVYTLGEWLAHAHTALSWPTRNGDRRRRGHGSFMQLRAVLSWTTHVGIASIFPSMADLASLLGYKRLRWIGLLRLLNLQLMPSAMDALAVDLRIPYSLPPMVKNTMMLMFSTHYAACLLWLLARWRNFSGNTWVGALRPDLIHASFNTQYIHSLYFSVATA